MAPPINTLLAIKISEAEAGVDFSRRFGARCPCCGRPAKIVRTRPWEGDIRLRYHRCTNSDCILSSSKTTIKSVEVEK